MCILKILTVFFLLPGIVSRVAKTARLSRIMPYRLLLFTIHYRLFTTFTTNTSP